MLDLSLIIAVCCAGPPQTILEGARDNFIVEAPSQEIARRLKARAEAARVRLAKQWFGRIPAWAGRCRIVARPEGGPDAHAVFTAPLNKDGACTINLQGPEDGLADHPMLDEFITFILLVKRLQRMPPRWVEQGVLHAASSVRKAREGPTKALKMAVVAGTQPPLWRLFAMKAYPDDFDLMSGQSESVTRFLIGRLNRPAFVEFVRRAIDEGWDEAAGYVYGFRSMGALEEAWLKSRKDAGK